jgi:hypothetical protein
LSLGLFSGLGFGFYDLHVYSDTGDFMGVAAVCQRAAFDKVPIVLGEFGQKSHVTDDRLQYKVTSRFLELAQSSCFSGALAWRFDAAEKWLSYVQSDGSLRPAAHIIRKLGQQTPRTRHLGYDFKAGESATPH